MSTQVAASVIQLYWDVADQYGISRQELIMAAGLDSAAAGDPNALIPRTAAEALLRALIRRADDPALGFRIARAFDLRKMGFWGYALLSSLSLRQRIQVHLLYSKLHNPTGQASLRIEGERAILDLVLPDVADDILQVTMDSGLMTTCLQLAKHLQCARPDVELWFTYPERPHHSELRALTRGPVLFAAPHFRVAFAAKELDRRLTGDAHLFELAKAQLEAQIAKFTLALNGDLLVAVRQLLSTRLSGDASLEGVAADMRISTRTLRRRLNALGATFHGVLEDVRRARAISYLVETNQAIERVAEYLGYRDPANFRRAFRRWTGAAPSDYRRRHRSGASAPVSAALPNA